MDIISNSFYERHEQPEHQFPFIFHIDKVNNMKFSGVHWHENIEILYFFEGSGTVFCNMVHYPVAAGDIAVIGSDEIHSVYAENSSCVYSCLIVDREFCAELDINVEELHFSHIINDEKASFFTKIIIKEMEVKVPYYRQSVKASVIGLLVYLCRNHLDGNVITASGAGKSKAVMVKSAIGFIRQRFKNPISIDEICEAVGFSKYYFCRVFKEYTGNTVTDYINFLRCQNARSLIKSGAYNAGESAVLSGIPNLSYFSKVYKKYIGVSPSEDK